MSLPYFLRFADLLTDDDIIDLVAPFKAERRIITTGAFSTSFTIPDSALGAQIAKIISSKTVVYRTRETKLLVCTLFGRRNYRETNLVRSPVVFRGSTNGILFLSAAARHGSDLYGY